MSQVTPQMYMENWLLQINYPEIGIILATSPQSGNSVVYFVQRRFLLSQQLSPDIIDPPSPFGLGHIVYASNYTCEISI
jgi:hypothetical protein